MVSYGIWCERTRRWLTIPNCVCNTFIVGEDSLPIMLALYHNMRNERAQTAQRGGYFIPADEQEKRATQKRYEAEWLDSDLSVRELGIDGKPTGTIFASGPLEVK